MAKILTKLNKFGGLIKEEYLYYIDPATTEIKATQIIDIRKPGIIEKGPNKGMMHPYVGVRIVKPIGLEALRGKEEELQEVAKHNLEENESKTLYLDLVLEKKDSMAMLPAKPPTVIATTKEELEAWMEATG